MKKWDAIVIGGGVAGSAAATLLARNGREVLLLEREEAAHDKVCGEFISIEAQHYLKKLGIDLVQLGAEKINQVRLIHKEKIVSSVLPFEALSLSRKVLDEAMLAYAVANGAQVERGKAVTGLEYEVAEWVIKRAKERPLNAHSVFLATGKHDLRSHSRKPKLEGKYIGFKMHFHLTPEQLAKLKGCVELVLYNGGYAGLEPVEGGKANLCLVVTKARFATCGKRWNQLLQFLKFSAPHLAKRLTQAEPCWKHPLSIFPIPYGFVYGKKHFSEPHYFRLGDQMAVIPSFCGEGMAIALHTAFSAVKNYLEKDGAGYNEQICTELLPQVRLAQFLSRTMSLPWMQAPVIWSCRALPGLISRVVARTRLKKISV